MHKAEMQSNATPEATKWNFLIHHHWLRQVVQLTAKVTCNAFCMTATSTLQNFDECLKLVEQVLQHSSGTAEYALQIKALIQRQRGEVSESLQLCQQAAAINRHSVATLKQVTGSWQPQSPFAFPPGSHRLRVCWLHVSMEFGILQVGRSLCLLGRFTAANDMYKEALQLVQTDWELWHSQGLVYTSLKMYDQ